jgi:hypothetical protein
MGFDDRSKRGSSADSKIRTKLAFLLTVTPDAGACGEDPSITPRFPDRARTPRWNPVPLRVRGVLLGLHERAL